MSLFTKFFTRKKKQNNTPPPEDPIQTPMTPHQAALIKKLAQEIVALDKSRERRLNQFRKTIMNTSTTNIYSPYEIPALHYLTNLLKALQSDPNPFFFNEAYAEFLGTKNEYVRSNTNVYFQKRKKSLPLINGVLRRMRQYAARLNNNTNSFNTLPRTPMTRRRESFDSVANNDALNTFSNTESTGSRLPSLPSLRSLRNNTRNMRVAENATRAASRVHTPKRRLVGKVVSPDTQPPTEV